MKTFFLITALLLATCTSLLAVPFTLHNGTVSSIPLIIPGVMNPNLNPFSDSGVDLKPGQKIYFLHKGKRYLLLEVTNALKGQTLEVGDVIRQRKTELGLK